MKPPLIRILLHRHLLMERRARKTIAIKMGRTVINMRMHIKRRALIHTTHPRTHRTLTAAHRKVRLRAFLRNHIWTKRIEQRARCQA